VKSPYPAILRWRSAYSPPTSSLSLFFPWAELFSRKAASNAFPPPLCCLISITFSPRIFISHNTRSAVERGLMRSEGSPFPSLQLCLPTLHLLSDLAYWEPPRPVCFPYSTFSDSLLHGSLVPIFLPNTDGLFASSFFRLPVTEVQLPNPDQGSTNAIVRNYRVLVAPAFEELPFGETSSYTGTI